MIVWSRGDIMFFRRLHDLRVDHDLSQQKLAEMLGCNYRVYGTYERGERELPVSMLIRLAEIYETSTDYILSLTDNPAPYK